MLDGVEGLDVLVVGVGVASILAGSVLGVRAVRNVATAFVASWFVLFGVLQVMTALDVARDNRAWILTSKLLYGAILGFGIAYPAGVLSARQRWLIAWVAIVVVGLALISGGDARNDLPLSALLSASVERLATVGVPLLLAWRWVRERGEHARAQIAWVLVPLAFWIVHDGVPVLVRLAEPGMVVGMLGAGPRSIALLAIVSTGVLGVALVGLGAIACLAWGLRHSARDGRGATRLGLALSALFPLSAPQYLVPTHAALATHFILDGLALFVLFYAVARYRVLGLDLKIRWGVARGTLAAFFLAAFFVASEAAQQFFGDTLGSAYVGIAAAGALVFAIAPLQRLAEHISARAVPMQQGPDAYLAYRRLQIYRAALEGALRDGEVKPWEEESLRALRRELGVTDSEHTLLERDVRTSLRPAAA